MSLKATPSAIWLIHQFLLSARPRVFIQPYLTNSLCPAPFLRPTCLPCLLLEAKPLQQAATWESSSLPQPSDRSSCLESPPDVETATQHPFPPCPLCSARAWSENSACPTLLIREGKFFLNFTLLPVCKNESSTHSRESITCMPEIKGNNSAGLLLQAQASAPF